MAAEPVGQQERRNTLRVGAPEGNTARDLNLVRFDLQATDWDSLERLCQQVVRKADDVARWYRESKRGKRWWAVRLRVFAIVLGGLATVTPTAVMLVSPLLDNAWARSLPLLASIFAAMAATLVLLDKFFGFSTAWIRYEAAYQEIEARTEAFQLGWARLRTRLSGQPLTEAQLGEALDAVTGFHASILDAVKQETQAWVAEFKSSLADLEKAAETRRAEVTPRRGALQVHVHGAEALDGGQWQLQLGDRSPVPHAGTSSVALTGVEPGLTRVRVLGVRGGAAVKDERVVMVQAGEVTEAKLKLG